MQKITALTDSTYLADFPDVLVPLENAGPQDVVSSVHFRALFTELHQLHGAVAALQKRAAGLELAP